MILEIWVRRPFTWVRESKPIFVHLLEIDIPETDLLHGHIPYWTNTGVAMMRLTTKLSIYVNGLSDSILSVTSKILEWHSLTHPIIKTNIMTKCHQYFSTHQQLLLFQVTIQRGKVPGLRYIYEEVTGETRYWELYTQKAHLFILQIDGTPHLCYDFMKADEFDFNWVWQLKYILKCCSQMLYLEHSYFIVPSDMIWRKLNKE